MNSPWEREASPSMERRLRWGLGFGLAVVGVVIGIVVGIVRWLLWLW